MSDEELTEAEINRLRESIASVPFANLLGIRFGTARRGSATLYMDMRTEIGRMEGIMHGGAIASLIDTASAFAVLSLLAPAQRTMTVDLTIHYLRPITQGRAEAHTRVLRAGRRLVSVSVDVTAGEGALVATALTTYVIQH